jgi:4-hydroxybenzoate polyprenyltransferase
MTRLSLPEILWPQQTQGLSTASFLLLTLATVIIAAAGYMINDYFDMSIDTINKPDRVTIEKIFSRRSIIIWHILLNVLALSMASYVYIHGLKWRWILVQLLSIFLLVIYSTSLKRKMLIGNISISILTALTVFSAASFQYQFPWTDFSSRKVLVFWLYTGFAFLITLIREIIKDLEDMKGDSAQDCKTLPLVYGANASKKVVYIICFLLFFLIGFALYQKTQPDTILLFLWIGGIVFPLLVCMFFLKRANTSAQFHQLSTWVKIITAFGILSMIFVR